MRDNSINNIYLLNEFIYYYSFVHIIFIYIIIDYIYSSWFLLLYFIPFVINEFKFRSNYLFILKILFLRNIYI